MLKEAEPFLFEGLSPFQGTTHTKYARLGPQIFMAPIGEVDIDPMRLFAPYSDRHLLSEWEDALAEDPSVADGGRMIVNMREQEQNNPPLVGLTQYFRRLYVPQVAAARINTANVIREICGNRGEPVPIVSLDTVQYQQQRAEQRRQDRP